MDMQMLLSALSAGAAASAVTAVALILQQRLSVRSELARLGLEQSHARTESLRRERVEAFRDLLACEEEFQLSQGHFAAIIEREIMSADYCEPLVEVGRLSGHPLMDPLRTRRITSL